MLLTVWTVPISGILPNLIEIWYPYCSYCQPNECHEAGLESDVLTYIQQEKLIAYTTCIWNDLYEYKKPGELFRPKMLIIALRLSWWKWNNVTRFTSIYGIHNAAILCEVHSWLYMTVYVQPILLHIDVLKDFILAIRKVRWNHEPVVGLILYIVNDNNSFRPVLKTRSIWVHTLYDESIEGYVDWKSRDHKILWKYRSFHSKLPRSEISTFHIVRGDPC